jgi:hypothetical protein
VATDLRAALPRVRRRGTSLAPTNVRRRRECSCKRCDAVRLAMHEALQRRARNPAARQVLWQVSRPDLPGHCRGAHSTAKDDGCHTNATAAATSAMAAASKWPAELLVKAKTSAPTPVIIAPSTAVPPTPCALDVLSIFLHATPRADFTTA